MTYDPNAYWTRQHERDDLSAVGQSGLPAEFNRWLYANGARNLERFLERHVPLAPAIVFDVGAGTGYWTRFWTERGSVVSGCDLVPSAVERLSQRFGDRFRVSDIAADPIAGTYDLVNCMNVLLHVTEDDAFERALRHLARGVRPGGLLLLAEPIARRPAPAVAGSSSRARRLDAYRIPLEDEGLTFMALEPTTVFGANPIEGGLVWAASWQIASAIGRRWPALAGRVIYAADPPALRLGFAPSGKFALFRR